MRADTYIGHLGRQDSEYDNSLYENAEAVTVKRPQKDISLPLLAFLVVVPTGLFILSGILLYRHLKGKNRG